MQNLRSDIVVCVLAHTGLSGGRGEVRIGTRIRGEERLATEVELAKVLGVEDIKETTK